MKSSILLLVLYSLQVSAMKEKRTPNTSPVQNIQAISPQDGDNLYLGISAQETPVCKNIADNFVNCLFSSPQFRRHMQQTLCQETEDRLIAKLRTEIVDLNKKLSLMQQREDDNKRKLVTIELETRLRMQEKEKEVNKTLASCRRETFETNKRLQALENLINTTEHRIIETVKHHSGLNFKHIDNAISSNKENIASFTNTLNEKLEMVEQRENDSTTKLENLLKEIEARLSLKFMQEKEINNTMASRVIEISETANRIENLINISEQRIKEAVKVHGDLNSILVENASSLSMQHEIDSTTKLENALKEIETRMSLKFMEKQKELNDTLRLFSEENKNRQQSLENLINTTENSIKTNLTLQLVIIQMVDNIKLKKALNKGVQSLFFSVPDFLVLSTGIYLFVNDSKMWSDARKHCQDRGMDLVAIETEAEDKALMQHAISMGGNIARYAYTSGCYSTASRSFVWRSTGHPLTYTNWASGYPTATSDSKCILINSSVNKWAHYSNSLPFICEFI